MGEIVGVKERQGREKEAVHRAILDAARELFVAEGYHSVSIRKIAEKIEYSPAAIYSYFASKDDIFLALAEEGFRLLTAWETDVPKGESRLDALRNAFLALYGFSKVHPEYYSLMFLDRSVPKISQDWQRFGFVREMRRRAEDLVRGAIADGVFPADASPEATFRILIAAIHGAATLRVCDRLIPGEDADALARDTLEATLAGLRTGFPRTYHPAPGSDSCHRGQHS
jgi:AcrR family transcriptional regulator